MEKEQMVNSVAPAMKPIPRPETNAFIRQIAGNKIFYLTAVGKRTMVHPVRNDGAIFGKGKPIPPGFAFEIIHPHDLGIMEVKWVK